MSTESEPSMIFNDVGRDLRELTAADELLHAPPSVEDRWWTETSWWALTIPEHRLGVWIYHQMRPNIPIACFGLWVFGPDSVAPNEFEYSRFEWHLEMPQGDLDDLSLVPEARLQQLEPFRRHRLTYDDGKRLQLHVDLEAATEPHALGLSARGGHYDQLLRATGTLQLPDRQVVLDRVVAARDRSWSSRPDVGGHKAYYVFGSGDDESFQALVVFGPDGVTPEIVSGFIDRNGKPSDVTHIRRRVEARSGDAPSRVVLEIDDALGRHLDLRGETVCGAPLQSWPRYLTWVSSMRWFVHGGAELHGEDHETWTPETGSNARQNRAPLDDFDIAYPGDHA